MSDYTQKINEILLDLISKGTAPWQMPWKVLAARNPITKTIYQGRNQMLLNAVPFDNCQFVTFLQAKQLGGTVKKGERSWPVVWYSFIGGDASEEEQPDEHKLKGHPCLKGYAMFNVDQCEGIDIPNPLIQLVEFNPIEAAEKIVADYDFPTEFGGNRACYSPSRHEIQMPKKERFQSENAYYSVYFHELIHSTGKALKRSQTTQKSTRAYAFEELVAQIGSSYLSRECNLDPTLLEADASYIDGWIRTMEWKGYIEDDKVLFLKASSAARKAVCLILGHELNEGEE